MTEREKMLAGQLYDCGDEELLTQWHKAKDLVRDYNQTDSANLQEKERILNELLGGKGKNLWITAPFYADYGDNIYFTVKPIPQVEKKRRLPPLTSFRAFP